LGNELNHFRKRKKENEKEEESQNFNLIIKIRNIRKSTLMKTQDLFVLEKSNRKRNKKKI